MLIGRREAITGLAVASLATAAPATACTITASRKQFPISPGLASAKLREFASFLSTAHALSDDEMVKRADDWDVSFDNTMLTNILGDKAKEVDRGYAIYPAFAVSEGIPDDKPIKVVSVELLREVKGRCLFQTTFQRSKWSIEYPDDDCGVYRAEGFYAEDASYLATFYGNRLRSLKDFSEWLDL